MASAPIDIPIKVKGLSDLQKVTARMEALEKQAKKAQGTVPKAANGIRAFGSASKGASVGVATLGAAVKAALGPIGLALAAVGGLTAGFDTLKKQDFAQAKFKSLGGDAEALTARLKVVSKELGGSASVADLTAAAYDVASAGFIKAADAAAVLKAASLGATGGFSDINTVGNAATSVLNAYGLAASEAGVLVDKFIQTQNDGKIVVEQYAQNIGKVASAAAGLGIPLEEVNAVIAQSTAAGVNAEVAFTGLKTALAQLASGQATDRMKELGLDINAATLESDGLIGTLRKIKDSGADVGQVFKLLGTESAPALLPVLNNLERFEELIENQKNSIGAAAEAQQVAGDTITGAWNRVTVSLQNLFSEQAALGQAIKVTLDVTAKAVEGLGVAIKFLFPQIWGAKKATDGLGDSAQAAATKQEAAAAKTKAAADASKAAAGQQVAAVTKAKELNKGLTEQYVAQGLALDKRNAVANNSATLAQAQLTAEKTINGVLLTQAETKLAGAKSAGEQLKFAKEVYDLTLEQAKLEYESTLATIDAMVRKSELAREAAELKLKEVEAAMALAAANKESTEKFAQAVDAQRQAVDLAGRMLTTTQGVAEAQTKAADAVLKGAKSTAKAAFEQNKVWQATKGSASAAGQYASNMERGAAAAQKAAAASSRSKNSWSIGQSSTTTVSNPNYQGSQQAINDVLSTEYRKFSSQDSSGNWNINYGLNTTKGLSMSQAQQQGYDVREAISDRTEFLDPNSRYNTRNRELMEGSAAWAAQGQAGGGNISVNYNGDRLTMNNDDYVKTSDVNGIVKSAVGAMQNKMTRSSSSRLAMGLS